MVVSFRAHPLHLKEPVQAVTLADYAALEARNRELEGQLASKNILLLVIAGQSDKVITQEAYDGVEAVRLAMESLKQQLTAAQAEGERLRGVLNEIAHHPIDSSLEEEIIRIAKAALEGGEK